MSRRLIVRTSGETLIEVVIAVTLLTLVLASAFGVLIQVAASNVNSLHRVEGLNIAREGIEAVRNIRDTNWLKYSGDRRGKWLCLDTTANPNACENNNSPVIITGVYRIDFSDSAERYFLEKIDEPFMAKGTLPTENFRLYETAAGRISHVNLGEALSFYRQIQLTPEETYLNALCQAAGCPQDIRLHVLVRVQWVDGNRIRSLDLETYLYDFFNRESY
jgi:type II secretory pathway pseudopilin PulG